MTLQEKYRTIKAMRSISYHTNGQYPTFWQFLAEWSRHRVAGTFGEKVWIVSDNPNKEYCFIADKAKS